MPGSREFQITFGDTVIAWGSARFGFCEDMPRQQFLDSVDGMVGDALQDLAKISFRVEAVQFGRADQTVDGGSPFPTGI